MDNSPANKPISKAVNQGPWWLLAIAFAASLVCAFTTVGTLQITASWLLSVWFGVGLLFVLFKWPSPPRGAFLVLLLVAVVLAGFVLFSGQGWAVIPGAVALIGLVLNLF